MADEIDDDAPAEDADDIIEEAKKAFEEAQDAEDDNRKAGLDDLRFARLGEQWPDEVAKARQRDGRPMLTVNRMNTLIRQVVNDARQNKPSAKARPVDSKGDVETAEVLNGIIRNIEASSSADIAYDTAIESAVAMGFGYWRIGLDYAHDDTFDLDITIEEIPDALSVYGDPWATSKDGSDWNVGFVVERMSSAQFRRRYKGAEESGWEDAYDSAKGGAWINEEGILVAEYWTREEASKTVVLLSDGTVVDVEKLKDPKAAEELAIAGITPTERTRTVPTHRVKQRILTGVEVLKERDWPGRWIPIVPVYGDEVNVEGKRHFRSLIRDAKDAQRMLNFWRTAGTELVALAPRVPWIGPEVAFAGKDKEKWAQSTNQSYATLSYQGTTAPTRNVLDTSAVGAMQQAMQASDDIKSTTGLFDASLGAKGNETSGKAILARQREGDVSTFHFADNLTRSIRQSGRILIDLIPKVWTDERVVRLVGEDGSVTQQKVNAPVPVLDDQGKPMMEPDPSKMPAPGQPPPVRPRMRTFDLAAGKYDLTAAAGPSYTTKREEAANQMMEFVRAFPAAAPVIGDLLANNLDWPGAEEIAERLKAMLPPAIGGGLPPEVEQIITEGKAMIDKLTAENEQLKADRAIKMGELQVKQQEMRIDAYQAETDRMEAVAKLGIPYAPISVGGLPQA